MSVILQHGGNITTLYAHTCRRFASERTQRHARSSGSDDRLSSVQPALRPLTHLHYEYRLNGVHRNPRTVSLPQAEPIDEQVSSSRFLAQSSRRFSKSSNSFKTNAASGRRVSLIAINAVHGLVSEPLYRPDVRHEHGRHRCRARVEFGDQSIDSLDTSRALS